VALPFVEIQFAFPCFVFFVILFAFKVRPFLCGWFQVSIDKATLDTQVAQLLGLEVLRWMRTCLRVGNLRIGELTLRMLLLFLHEGQMMNGVMVSDWTTSGLRQRRSAQRKRRASSVISPISGQFSVQGLQRQSNQ
jgi:hypothetical protein